MSDPIAYPPEWAVPETPNNSPVYPGEPMPHEPPDPDTLAALEADTAALIDAEVADALRDAHLIDWDTFWTREHTEEWEIEPVIPKGRHIAVIASGKTGKSLVTLDMAAAYATGRPLLGQPNPHGPRDVLYLDYEMTEADVQERLTDMGYGPDDDLSHLHYALLPAIDPLDTAAGGLYVLRLALYHGVELVIIDTFARAIDGPENDADTYRAFYLRTAMLLKQAGITLVRLDHLGHGNKDHARGSSAKGDDVDLAWILTAKDDGLHLKHNGISRVPWVPAEVHLRRETEPRLRHILATHPGWPSGTQAVADQLDQMIAPLNITVADAQRLTGKRKTVVAAAVKFRRQRAENGPPRTDPSTVPEPREPPSTQPDGTAPEPPNETAGQQGRNRAGTPGTAASAATGTNGSPKGDPLVPRLVPDPSQPLTPHPR